MNRFTDKTIVITGAGSGIGEATARRFLSEGAHVAVVDVGAEKLASYSDAVNILTIVADVSEAEACVKVITAALDRFGKIDVLCNNAGTDHPGSADKTTVDDWRGVLKTDLDSVFYMSHAALPKLIQAGGCIINTASVSGLGGDWNHAAYCAAKGGVVNLTRAMALDCGKHGIRVNAVAPALTMTGMTTSIAKDEPLMAKFRERIPLGRAAQPDEVAAAIAFLASDDARFITGVILPVDGGTSASNGQPPLE